MIPLEEKRDNITSNLFEEPRLMLRRGLILSAQVARSRILSEG